MCVCVCCRCKSCWSGSLYRVVYDDSYTDRYAVLRASKSFGQKKYDVFEQNCEHSTRWCKTGIRDSVQMETCFTSAGKVREREREGGRKGRRDGERERINVYLRKRINMQSALHTASDCLMCIIPEKKGEIFM